MNSFAAVPNLQVLIAATTLKDVELTVNILQQAGFTAQGFEHLQSMTADAIESAGALLISEELLFLDSSDHLASMLKNQPAWSDLPILILTAAASSVASSNSKLEKILFRFRNVTLIERPVRIASLITSVRAALYGRQRQYEVRDLLLDLKKSKESAEEANRAKSSFLANMSHEIRTPLGAILGFSELLKEDDLTTPERDQYIETIRRNGESLALLIDDILDLSKVESGFLKLENVLISLPNLIKEVDLLLQQTAVAKGIALKVFAQTDLPITIMTDPTRLRQILINILGNAIKFTKEGEVSLTVRSRAVSLRQAELFFEVQDTGCGISTGQSQKLFQAFSQADNSTTRLYGGTGLGLALSQKLARALGGDLQLVKSELNKGSTFLIQVPVVVEEATQTVAKKEEKAPQDWQELVGLRVLLAEDTPDNQSLVCHFLSAGGVQVDIVTNGQEAVRKALVQSYDLILMDIQMPVQDGYSATRELRGQGYQGPIVALTAHAMKEDRELSNQAGCNGHLTKPINRSQLLKTVATFAPGKALQTMAAQTVLKA